MVEGFRLSPQQRRIWLLQQAGPASAYGAQCAIAIGGALRPDALKAAVAQVVERHEILRTAFERVPGMAIPLQVIGAGAVEWAPDQALAGQDEPDRAAQLAALLDQMGERPFDLERGPALHAALAATPAGAALLLHLPALCADAATLLNLAREIALAYAGTGDGADRDDPLQYADIAEWQIEVLGGEHAEEGRSYWRRQSQAAGSAPQLPFELPPHERGDFAPRRIRRALGPELAAGLAELAERAAVPLSTALLAGWRILCWRLSGQDDPLVGAAFDGRAYEGLSEALGPLAKYLPIGGRLAARDSFVQIVAQLNETLQEAGQWQEYFSWDDWPASPEDDAPAFLPVGFDYAEQPPAWDAAGATFALERRNACVERFTIRLSCERRGADVAVELHYDAGSCPEDAIERLAEQYRALLASAVADPAAPIAALALLGEAERRTLAALNDTRAEFPGADCVHRMFEDQAARAPDRVAVAFEDQHLTYAALNARANQLARTLRARGLGPDQPAALCIERSPALIVGLLGALKAGSAYLPIDPTLPPERRALLLRDARILVTADEGRRTKDERPGDSFGAPQAVDLRADWPQIAQADAANLDGGASPAQLAYVLFTSGSTGAPKGVAVEHRQLRNYVCAITAQLALPEGSGYATVSTIAADLGNTAIFPSLCGGGTLHVVSRERAASADALADYVARRRIDCLKIVPSHLAALLAAARPQDVLPRRRLVLGGEAASPELVQKIRALAPGCAILNHYGPTEATVGALTYAVDDQADPRAATVPLGRPLANMQVYILDARLQPVPLGAPGELYIGGSGVARGYLGRPDLTAERFIPNPFAQGSGARSQGSGVWGQGSDPEPRSLIPDPRIYRTGDLARCRADGVIEFLGRADDQVKIRGFRVEPGEVAAALLRHPAVQDAAVVARADAPDGERRLAAYFVPDQRAALPVRQMLRMGQAGQLDARRYALPNGTVVAQLNPHETDLLYREIFEQQIYLQHGIALADGDCVFDVGANIGMFALFVAQRCANPTIYAFEPIPPLFELLRANTALYGLNARLFNCGLAGERRRATFTYYPHASVMSGRYSDPREEREVIRAYLLNQQRGQAEPLPPDLLDEMIAQRLTGEQFVCELRTISDVIREHGVERIDLLKLDVQKSELDVLAGIADGDWPKIRQIVLEVHDIDGRLEAITALLRRHGYDLAVEQEELLADTPMYDIYAARPDQRRAGAPARPPAAPLWSDPAALIEDLRRFLAAQLPDYMQPAAFTPLDAIPLTPNGKLDRAALPDDPADADEAGRDFAAPRSELEQMLAEIWIRLLGVDRVGLDDSFFALGGHSLLATRLVARIRSVFQVDLPLNAIFEAPALADMAGRLERAVKAAEGLQAPPVGPAERAGALPLSPAQQGMWFIEQLDAGNPSYHIPLAAQLRGRLDLGAMRRSIAALIRRHEPLRTAFPAVEGRAVQLIAPPERAGQVAFPLLDLRGLPAAVRAGAAQRMANAEAQRPFDLARGPLFRAGALRLADDEHLLLLSMHHIVSDGWSLRVLMRDLAALYRVGGDAAAAGLPDLPIQYADYAIWQRNWMRGSVQERLLAYWRAALAGAPLVLELPSDRPRPAVASYRGATLRTQFPAPLAEALRALVRREGVTMYMALLAAFNILLARYSGQNDIVVASSTANRTRGETEDLIGLFLNMLIVRTRLDGVARFGELLRRVREVTLGAYAHQDLPFDQLVAELQPERDLRRNPLFQVSLVFLNLPAATVELAGLAMDLLETDTDASQIDLTLALMDTEQGLRGWLEYSSDLFDPATMERLLTHFQTLLEGVVASPDAPIWSLPLLPEAERRQILVEWNDTAGVGGQEREFDGAGADYSLVHELVAAWAARSPDAVAVVFDPTKDEGRMNRGRGSGGGDQDGDPGADPWPLTTEPWILTYGALNACANRLARHLRGLGVGPDVLVALCMEPSPELVIGILGILKAGGAYVPLDRGYPSARLAFMLEDSGAPLILTHSRLADLLPSSWAYTIQLDADWDAIAQESGENPLDAADARQLAYVIYTSGSTGEPKGVPVSHGNLTRSLHARFAYYGDEAVRMLLIASISFDSSVVGIFWPLCRGGALVIQPDHARADRDALLDSIERQRISHMIWLPSLYALVLDPDDAARMRSLRTLVVAGEAFPAALAERHRRLLPQAGIHNEYGPTEATIWSSVYPCHTGAIRIPTPIGRVIPNAQIYVLDARMQPAPIGIPGEIYIGGPGLARGYLGRPDLTAAVFVPNPFAQESGVRGQGSDQQPRDPAPRLPIPDPRLYKTGDLARWLPTGDLEFLGRIDGQVKLRGYRIELGEIVSALLGHPSVQDAVALVREDAPPASGYPDRRLVAYVVEGSGFRVQGSGDPASDALIPEPRSLIPELRAFLKARLPDYMIPSAFVALDAIPLTPNGKVDHKALPAPDVQRPADSFAAPRTPVETALAQIWAEVLRVERVGVNDDFFALGGDSILSIQIISRAHRVGLHFTPKQLFQHQTIAQLAAVVGVAPVVVAEQGLVEGAVPLTPAQRWLFERELPAPHYYNQPLLLVVRQPLDLGLLAQAIGRLRLHHDALRMRFVRSEFGWQQINDAAAQPVEIARFDYADLPATEQAAAIEAEAIRIQSSLDLATGELIRAAFFDLGAGQPTRLLLVIHHLVVDGVSWRILIEDLHSVYAQLQQGREVALPPKTTAFRQWAERLAGYARSEDLRRELDYWLADERQDYTPAPVDTPGGENTVALARKVSLLLSAEETDALLHRVPQAYRTQINDVLLTALALAWRQWTGSPTLLMDLEGHGREDLFEDVDLSRTVGWFTSIFPVRLDLGTASGPVAALQAVRNQLRAIPNHGVGYGLLRYMGDEDVRAELWALPQAEINFNYLGQADQSLPESGMFSVASESIGPIEGPLGRRTHLIEIVGIAVEGRLRLDWVYSEAIHRRATIARLVDDALAALRALIAQSGAALASGYTPFDFPLAQIDQPALDRLLGSGRQVEDIYPLAPLQQGMLFHTLYAPASGAYFKQALFTLRGALDIPAFQRAWQLLADRHAILRTSFAWEGLTQPLQLVHRQALLPWDLHDWRALAPGAQADRLAAYLDADRRRGFALGQAPLARMALLRIADDAYQFVWSQHHLLLDGWSLPLALNEVLQSYAAFTRGQTPQLAAPRPYREYIAWIQRQDQAQAELFWRRELGDFSAATPLGVERAGRDADQPDEYAEHEAALGSAETVALQALARRHGLTLNTLVQGSWALLLSRYSGQNDVVFGATVAGRPPNLPGSEAIIGMFINTLPVRARLQPAAPLLTWLRALQDQQLELRQYAYSPLVQIQGWSGVPRGQPLFESIVVFENYPFEREALAAHERPDLAIEDVRAGQRMGFPLTVLALPGPALTLRISYARQRFDDAACGRMLAQLRATLRGIAAHPERRVADIPTLPASERRQILGEWNDTGRVYAHDRSVQALFEDQAARSPDAIALVFDGAMKGEGRMSSVQGSGQDGRPDAASWSLTPDPWSLTYGELNRRANQLAHTLRALGVGPEATVGLYGERSPALIIGMLGVVKAGGVYVPLDPQFPQERIRFMLEDSGARVLIVTKDEGRRTKDEGSALAFVAGPSSLVSLSADWPVIARAPGTNPPCAASLSGGLYVIYTSGSTGRPKGVLIEQRQALNYVSAVIERLGCPPGASFAMVQPLAVDSSVTVIYPALCYGGALHLIDGAHAADGDALGESMQRYQIDCLKIAPSHLAALLGGARPERVLPRRWLVIGGEASQAGWAAQVRALMPGGAILNHYGPTETTVGVLTYLADAGGLAGLAGALPIGRPLANVQAYVLAPDLRPQPIGAPGELYIGGAQVARGYLGRPDLTAERFVPNPFAQGSGIRGLGSGVWSLGSDPEPRSLTPDPRLYRTGDLARFRPDGSIEFLGRIDDQVKIRGFRVELGEIAALLRRHPAVSDALVLASGDGADARIVAYLVTSHESRVMSSPGTANDARCSEDAQTNDDAALSSFVLRPSSLNSDSSLVTRHSSLAAELRDFLAAQLPAYMIPAAFVALDAFPRTPHGKLDRRALPAPDLAPAEPDAAFVAPRTPIEETLAQLWADVLGVDRVGTHADFFALGGHSLLATRLIYRVREAFQVELPLRVLFDTPTLAGMAALIARQVGAPDPAPYLALPAVAPDPQQLHQPFPLTDIQEAYWVGRNGAFELGNVATHNYMEIETVGLDLERFRRACQRLIDRHAMLRAIILPDGRQQVLDQTPPFEIPVLDLRGQPADLADAELEALRERLSHHVLPTDQWPLFEIRISRIDDQRARLHIGTDALILDGWSRSLIIREFGRLYRDPEAELAPIELSFRDYVLGELALHETELYQRSLRYWRERLPTLPPAPDLPLAQSPADLIQPQFVRRNRTLEPERWALLKRRAADAGLTSSGLILAAFAEILSAWSKTPRFTINLTLFNRLPLHPQVNEIVGDFTSLTLLAVDNRRPASFEARARSIQQQLWDDLDHRYVSGVQVLRELARMHGGVPGATMPIVLTSTLTLRQGSDDPQLDEFREIAYSISQTPQVWLDHQVSERADALLLNWDAVEDLFPAGMLDDMFEAYCGFVRRLADDEAAWSDPARLITPPAQLARQAAINDTAAPLSAALLHTLFADQATRRPGQVAVVAGARALTYAEVYQRAARAGGWLRHRGARRNALVAVVMEKGWEQIVATIGALLAGSAYLPIDPALPPERLRYLIEHSQVELALTQSWLDAQLDWPAGVARLCVDGAGADDVPIAPWTPAQDPGDLAYVIYTSGSTGVPKGVMIDHRAAVNTIVDLNERFGVGPDDRALALSALNFDLSVYDIFGLLAAGGALVLPPEQARRDPAYWLDLLERERVTIWNSVPALMQMLADYADGSGARLPDALRLVMLSGDWIPVTLPEQIAELSDGVEAYSLGGATEAAIWSILYPIDEVAPDWTSIPYGAPMLNQQFYVLNTNMQPCPTWVPGQLYIGGSGLALGYWRDPAKTAERFVPNPFVQGSGARDQGPGARGLGSGAWGLGAEPEPRTPNPEPRLYRTGDLGRYLPDGNIEFLGREDFQVKVQGHRIELGEIEAALAQHPLVRTAVVAALGDPRGNRRLAAYIVPDPEQLAARAPAQPARDAQANGAATNGATNGAPHKLDSAALAQITDAIGADAEDNAKLGPLARLEFKLRQPGVRREPERPRVPLIKPPHDDALSELYARRRSYRAWQAGPVGFAQFSAFLACLMQLQIDMFPLPKYRYPSAGNLYPVQFYLHIKPGGVEGVEPGAYYYHPIEHSLALLTADPPIDRSAHTPANQALFDQSAFTIFLVGRMQAIAPLYETMARDFCLLEAGYASQLLMTAAPDQQIGLCPLGTAHFDQISEFFALEDDDILLHSLIGGSIAPVARPGAGAQTGAGGATPALRVTSQVERAVADELRQFVQGKLPEYMTPSAFVLLDALPLTPNGKIDRAALPTPSEPRREQRAAPGAPLTDAEQTIAAVWQAVLGVDQVGLEDNFFELGGSSVHLVRMHSKLRDALQREIPLVDLFKYPTIRALAEYLGRQHQAQASFQDIRERMQRQKASLARQKPRRGRS